MMLIKILGLECLLGFVSLGCRVFWGVEIMGVGWGRFGCNVSSSILAGCHHQSEDHNHSGNLNLPNIGSIYS